MEQDKKKAYTAPEIKVALIELEESIATNSARVKPGSSTGQVQQEWDQGADDNRNYNW